MLRVFLAALGVAACAGCAPDAPAARAADASPLIEVATAEALVADIDQTTASTVVLNFWATWCVPCIAEFPVLIAFDRERAPGVEVRFVSVDDPTLADDVKAFLDEHGVTDPSYLYTGTGDVTTDLNPLFMGGAIPVTMILDPEGTVEYTHVGTISRDELDRLVAEAEAARS